MSELLPLDSGEIRELRKFMVASAPGMVLDDGDRWVRGLLAEIDRLTVLREGDVSIVLNAARNLQMLTDRRQGTEDDQLWVLTLDRYERDNLLHLLNAVGYPAGNPHSDPALRGHNTGDWNGQIPHKLARLDLSIVVGRKDRPNFCACPDTEAQTSERS